MWFPILITISLISILIYYIRKAVKGRGEDPFTVVFPSVALVAWFAVWILIYVFSIQTVANLEAFFRSTKSAYEHSVTATKEIEIKALKKIEESENPPMQMFDSGRFAYFKLAPVASERIMEFRNKIEWYNATLESYKRWNHFWFTKGFIADVQSDLKPIIMMQ